MNENRMPRVAAVNDLSGFGRCSLTVALPVLSAMGVQVCPVPTAVLSAHTGYPGACIHDCTAELPGYLKHWKKLGLEPDAVYTGFLGSEDQARIVENFVRSFARRDALRLVDPAMADNGRMYSTCTPGLCAGMKQLVSMASVTTPNLTEACLLTGADYDEILRLTEKERRQAVLSVGRQIAEAGAGAVVVTGVPGGEDKLENLVVEKDGLSYVVATPRVDSCFAGTGDVFASVLCGCLMRGIPLKTAVQRTANFVCKVTAYTHNLQTPEQDGIAFEPFICSLSDVIRDK